MINNIFQVPGKYNVIVDENNNIGSLQQVIWHDSDSDELFLIPGKYNIIIDDNNNVGALYEVPFTQNNNQEDTIENKIERYFEEPIEISSNKSSSSYQHLAFPGGCPGNDPDTIHVVYRGARTHVAQDDAGVIVYKYSKDNGKSWSNERIVLSDQPGVEGWFVDYRDSRLIRRNNGVIQLITWGTRKNINGSGDKSYPLMVSFVENELTHELEKTDLSYIPLIRRTNNNWSLLTYDSIPVSDANTRSSPFAGGVIEYNNDLYITLYASYNIFLLRQKNEEWELLSVITNEEFSLTESGINIINNKIFIVARAAVANADYKAIIYSSGSIDIQGSTEISFFEVGKTKGSYHGQSQITLNDFSFLVCGRSYNNSYGCLLSIINDEGDERVSTISFNKEGPITWDSAYCQIFEKQGSLYFIYYITLQDTNEIKINMSIIRKQILSNYLNYI